MNGCQGFSMDAYPVESLDGGELLVEFLKEFLYLTNIANNWRKLDKKKPPQLRGGFGLSHREELNFRPTHYE